MGDRIGQGITRWLALACAAGMIACGGLDEAGSPDASAQADAHEPDAHEPADAGAPDARTPDASMPDAVAPVDASMPDALASPDADDPDGGNTSVCNPVTQTGCAPGEKCTWIIDSVGPPLLGHTGCTTDGTQAGGYSCTRPPTGADDCVAGYYCLAGACKEICSVTPNTCAVGSFCSKYATLMGDLEGVGLCAPGCDPVAQTCANTWEACYLQAITGESMCAGVPGSAVGNVQGETCYGPTAGVCYLNGCDKGHGALLPDGICAFFCNPIENWATNIQGLAGDPSGTTCDATFGGARPDGPGPGFECRYIQTFYGNTENVPASVGMCVDPDEWGGSCALFDYDQLVADIASGATESATYCADFPERCMFDCISLATFEALFP